FPSLMRGHESSHCSALMNVATLFWMAGDRDTTKRATSKAEPVRTDVGARQRGARNRRAAGKGNAAARRYGGVRRAGAGVGAQPGQVVARLVVIARKDGAAVADWTGSIAWSGALPATLTAAWTGERWAWSDGDANKTVCIEGA